MAKKIPVLLVAALLLLLQFSTMVYAAAPGIDGPSSIAKEANQVFTVGDLLSLYDMDVFIESDGYTGYGNVPGDYTVVLNQGALTKDVTITVVDSWGNLEDSNDVLFVTDGKDIYVANDRALSLYEIIYYIYGTTGYVITDYQFRYQEILDEYHYSFDDEGIIPEGSYELTFRLTYYSGQQATYSAMIHTVELQELPGTILEPPATFMDKIMTAIPWILGAAFIFYLLKNRKKGGFKHD